ncbi:uncharacterized protein LOC127746578 isoform X3 [Arachis duranensis]|uniref:Uncharacterized protein LOC127746578 isoform X3 n=1 Tax=Arachis duranensis TaxID=130453 RepID=A0A9C6TVV6_ARADU|nr:uncharacterized protein LOC127746578 isoform X3 [Arachis duranensis]
MRSLETSEVKQTLALHCRHRPKVLSAAAIPKSSTLPLLPLPHVWSPGSSARRVHHRWLLCSWLGASHCRVAACRRLAYRLVSPFAIRVSVEGGMSSMIGLPSDLKCRFCSQMLQY